MLGQQQLFKEGDIMPIRDAYILKIRQGETYEIISMDAR